MIRRAPVAARAALLSVSLVAGAAGIVSAQGRDARSVILATTTSLNDTGLLDSLAPQFERATGYRLRAVAAGSGQALKMGERGDADVILAHSPAAEATFMQSGFGLRRRVVATNYFTLVGPPADPARVREAATVLEALRRIASAGAVFISRGDSSGTHARELQLWRSAGGRPSWSGYVETGQGQANSLLVANERRGYMLTDRGTWLSLRNHLDLVQLRQADTLLNVYHVIELNPRNNARINAAGGTAFADWIVSPVAQDLIGAFGRARYGEALFTPARGVEPQ